MLIFYLAPKWRLTLALKGGRGVGVFKDLDDCCNANMLAWRFRLLG